MGALERLGEVAAPSTMTSSLTGGRDQTNRTDDERRVEAKLQPMG